MRIRFKLFTLLFCIGLCLQLNAQDHKIEDVLSVNVKNSGVILNEDKVEGYYIFYSSGKAKKGNKNFVIRILDTELNKVLDKKITMDKTATLLNGVSNGRSLAFRFFVPKDKQIITKGYDFKGNQLFSKTIEVKKAMEIATLGEKGSTFFRELGLTSIPGYGYMQINPYKEKKFGYSVNYIPDNKTQKSFSKKSDSDKFQNANNLCTAGDLVVNLIMTRQKALSAKDMDMHLQGVDLKTGKQTFRTSLKSLKYNTMILNGETAPDGENFILYGLNFPKGEKITSKPKGMIKFIMNKKGEVVNSYTFDWRGKSIKLDDGEEAGNLFVHEFMTGDNGNTYIIAEQLNINVGASIVGSVIGLASGGSNNFTFKVDDMVVIELDPEFNVQGIELIEKQQNSYTLPGTPFGGVSQVGLLAERRGYFDYSYCQHTDEGFMIGYVNRERGGGLKRKYIFGGVTNVDNEYSYDKIELTQKGVQTNILRGKPGYVLLMDYYKKEKAIDMHLEKINF